MYKILTDRRDSQDRDGGFTLIELMVVVLIIAILLAIAIPTFLGAQTSAKDRGAQSTARNALTIAKTVYADTGDYSNVKIANLEAAEPGLTFDGVNASVGPKDVSVVEPTTTGIKMWYAAVLSESGTCYYIRDSIVADATAGTMYAKGTGACKAVAESALPVTNPLTTYTADGWD